MKIKNVTINYIFIYFPIGNLDYSFLTNVVKRLYEEVAGLRGCGVAGLPGWNGRNVD